MPHEYCYNYCIINIIIICTQDEIKSSLILCMRIIEDVKNNIDLYYLDRFIVSKAKSVSRTQSTFYIPRQ